MTAPATAQMVMQVQRAQPPAPATAVTVVEYYLRASDRDVLTGRADEEARLDAPPALFALFARTGTSVDACSTGNGSTGSEDYCRFYVSIPVLGVSSHFYGTKSTDCPAIISAKLTSHAFEGYDFSAMRTKGWIDEGLAMCAVSGVAYFFPNLGAFFYANLVFMMAS